jgi:hypothetical protein
MLALEARPSQKPRVGELGRVCLEPFRRSVPAQLFDVIEKSSVRAKRRESLEQKCTLSALAEDFRWKAFKRAVAPE